MCSSMEKNFTLCEGDTDEHDPTVQVWLYYFIAQHHLNLGETDNALTWVNKGIEHTPTVIELYLVKAKIMQFAGNRR